ncbi:hypothetical protein BDF19DRAFT_440430 [Syncephalis fuscata]|nr:hypothetical protein BDF19DRAFT_440430 [Syncephalis fuscata]
MTSMADKTATTPLAQLTLNDVLEDRQQHLVGPKELVAAHPSTTVRTAMETLHTYNITALPVYSHDRPGVIVNIVNTYDLLNYVISFSQHYANREKELNAAQLQQASNLKLNESIEAVMTLDPDRESYRLIQAERYDTLTKLLDAFSAGGHYGMVVDEHPSALPSTLVTQADIVRFAARYPQCLHGLNLDASLEQLGCLKDKQPLVSVNQDQTALDAFAIMQRQNLHCVPVLDQNGQLVANLRAFDAGFVAASQLSVLYRPVIDFLKMATNAPLTPVTCLVTASLRELLDGMIRSRTHHVWVVNDKGQPEQVISLTDMMRLLRSTV